MKKIVSACIAALMTAALVAAPVMAAPKPVSLGTFDDWKAFKVTDGTNTYCYVLSQPKKNEPTGVRRDPIFFLITKWTGRAGGEPSYVPGYPYKEGSSVTATIGADKFTFFTRNEGTDGGAWIRETAEEARLVTSLRGGSSLVVTGISRRGTNTRDEYSLKGISAALDKINEACP